MSNASQERVPNTDFANLTSEPASEATDPAVAERQALEARIGSLFQQGRRGANWFYWVAGLSLVNSAILLTGGTTFFVVGLGVTLMVDAIATGIAKQEPGLATLMMGIAIALDILAALIGVGFGWLAGKRYLAVFAIGMVLYLLDGVLFAVLGDWMSVAFHAFALMSMWSGFKAYRQLKVFEYILVNQPIGSPSGQSAGN